jgi:hypothetical protein
MAKRAKGWPAWLKKVAASAALWLAAIIVPVFLWLVYLVLTYIGLKGGLIPWLYLVLFVVATAIAWFINPNKTSLHGLYRDRLAKAFLFDPDPGEDQSNRDEYHDLKACEPKLHEIKTKYCPYPIINAALNIEASQYVNKRGRNADSFILTPEYTGSGATGYIGTANIKAEEAALDLGTAMAISGAAVSPEMGSGTIKPLIFTLALLNFRLGYWLRNPCLNPPQKTKAFSSEMDTRSRQENATKQRSRAAFRFYGIGKRSSWLDRLKACLFKIPSVLLFAELFGLIREDSRKVYLTDGGHIENLGIYSLLKRHCEVIIAIDAEADPTISFASLLILERYARIDFGAIIELPWRAIRDCTLEMDKAFDKPDKEGSVIPSSRGPHCAAGKIRYGPDEDGILLYVKASLNGDENDYILDYKRRHRAFPHETTSDQFFGEEQLEAYRALGFHIVKGLMTGKTPFAVKPEPNETEDAARARILKRVHAALRD